MGTLHIFPQLITFFVISVLIFQNHPSNAFFFHCNPHLPVLGRPIHPTDVELLQFALNLEYLETEWFLNGALGYGLDTVEPRLAGGGPVPLGARAARLDNVTREIIAEFGYQEVGHLRAIKSTVGGFPRPLIDLRAHVFAKIMDSAFGYNLDPPFNPYHSTINYLIASYLIPYVGLVGYVGASPNINGYVSKGLLAGLLAVESGQDAVIRTFLYQRANEIVLPYKNLTVADFTTHISRLRNQLGSCGNKDEGILVDRSSGAERRTSSNVLSADGNSVAYRRTPAEILRIVYGTGDESRPGGFLPRGGGGTIATDMVRFRLKFHLN
ncbi:desiccation-related protein PCC13-62-like isoform X1 [Carex littledalei]|uniref:Desiccation-related protein PCC13-62-like isoform X1 n=1 Tax=Carex littledalei TaxID=544730 RepID=A0A833VFX1_9POAL|nr:desiccation-related protein PCC13-62-like isoform X1 [Carex littledalei]